METYQQDPPHLTGLGSTRIVIQQSSIDGEEKKINSYNLRKWTTFSRRKHLLNLECNLSWGFLSMKICNQSLIGVVVDHLDIFGTSFQLMTDEIRLAKLSGRLYQTLQLDTSQETQITLF